MAKKRTLVPFYSKRQRWLEQQAIAAKRRGADEQMVNALFVLAEQETLKRAAKFAGDSAETLRSKLRESGLHKHKALPRALKRAIRETFAFGV